MRVCVCVCVCVHAHDCVCVAVGENIMAKVIKCILLHYQ